jgi:hypothetical protein
VPPLVLAAALVLVVALVAAIAWTAGRGRRRRRALIAWGEGRGLAYVRRPPVPQATPFLRQSGLRVAYGVVGEIDGRPGGVHVVRWNAASGGVRVRREATVLCVAGAVPGVPRLVLRPRVGAPGVLLTVADTLTGDRHVAFESAAFAERYDVRVSVDADEVAVRALFDPARGAGRAAARPRGLAAREPFVLEVEGGALVALEPGVVVRPARLDDLVARLAAVVPVTR